MKLITDLKGTHAVVDDRGVVVPGVTVQRLEFLPGKTTAIADVRIRDVQVVDSHEDVPKARSSA